MIDTLQFSVPLEAEHIYNFYMKFGGETFNSVLNSQGIHGIKIYLFKKCKPIRITIFVDCKFMLGKIVQERDYLNLEKKLLALLDLLFDDNSIYDKHTLTRLDYSFDIEIIGLEDEKNLLRIMQLQTAKYRRIKLDAIYATGIVFETNSDSIEIGIYDKTEERGEVADIHILRFEIRLKNDHLYNFSVRKGVKKQIRTFFSLRLFTHYMEEYLFKILYKGDYFSQDSIQSEIELSNLKGLDKHKLMDIVDCIASNGIEAVKASMSSKTFRKRINMLQALNINPFIIPSVLDKNYLEGIYPRFLKEYENAFPTHNIEIS